MKKRLKKILFLSITFLFLFSFSLNVNASVIENNNIVVISSIKNDFTRNIRMAEKKDTCEKILGDPEHCDEKCPAYWIQWILDTMKYIAIVALLLLVTVDFLKAVVNNDKDALKNYVYMRDKLLLIANEKVIIKLLDFEDKGVGKTTDLHNKYLTELLKAIRKDLKLGYKSLPILCLKK